VDSGAAYSVFGAEDGIAIGLDLTKGLRRYVVVGDGGLLSAAFFRLSELIGDVEFQAEIGFAEKLGIGFNLLGRKDVFEKFQVCFSDANRVLSFHYDEASA
jgi:hypothetical protein